jgi:hypothetical protein
MSIRLLYLYFGHNVCPVIVYVHSQIAHASVSIIAVSVLYVHAFDVFICGVYVLCDH